MNAKAVATVLFLLGLLAVGLWYEPSREELAFSDAYEAALELPDVLPPLPDGAHDIHVFGHQAPESLHLKCVAAPDAVDEWLVDAEEAKSSDTVMRLPLIVDSITWWHADLRMGGQDGGSRLLPPTYLAYGYWVAVDGTDVYLWPVLES
jgi:hypothetical protein